MITNRHDLTSRDRLKEILEEKQGFSDWPKKEHSSLRQKAYRKWKTGHYELKGVYDPRSEGNVVKIVWRVSGKIVLKKSEIESLVKKYYEKTKGEGAKKIRRNMQNIYSGVAEKNVHNILNKMKEQQKLRPLFKKAPFCTITAKKVQERNQVHLVDMSNLPITTEGKTYKYILSVIDIFSRYLHLRPLESKESLVVAHELISIYYDHGVPEILQSDQGTEFKGTVENVCKELGVKIIRSSAYTPTTQGKNERSHRTWKEKLRFDPMNCNDEGVNWVKKLPLHQQLYNKSPHRSLGLASPFEIYYGHFLNRLKNRLSLNANGATNIDIEEETLEHDTHFTEPTLEEIEHWKNIQDIF